MSTSLPQHRAMQRRTIARRGPLGTAIALVSGVAFTGAATVAFFGADAAVGAQDAHAVPPEEFIEDSVPGAQESQEETEVPASVTIAQAALESSWGESDLSVNEHNYFGIKCASPDDPGPIAAGCENYPTEECDETGCHPVDDWFRSYDSRADSYEDHGVLLRDNERYAPAFDYTDDPDQFIREVHEAGYATDPEYSDKIITIMETYDLYQYN